VQRILIAFVATMMTLLLAGTAIAQETTTSEETTTPAIAQETTTSARAQETTTSAARRQYGDTEVIVKTIPDKGKLADTGGASLNLPAGALLLSMGLLLGRSVIRRAL
jgi:hypothetical protein